MSKFSVGGMKASGIGSLLSSGRVESPEGLFRRRNFAFRFEDLYTRRLFHRRSYLCIGCGLAEFGARRIDRSVGEGFTRAWVSI